MKMLCKIMQLTQEMWGSKVNVDRILTTQVKYRYSNTVKIARLKADTTWRETTATKVFDIKERICIMIKIESIDYKRKMYCNAMGVHGES